MSDIDFNLHKREGYSDPAPYPTVRVQRPNKYYMHLLQDDLAGVVSELTAINQYLYHYFIFKNHKKQLGELLESVALNEMLHMEIIAQLIFKLGGKPIFKGGPHSDFRFFNSRYVSFGNYICDMVLADIEAEYQAIKQYEKHTKLIKDNYITEMLQRIILDEKVHIKLFKQALFEHCGR